MNKTLILFDSGDWKK